LERRAQYRHLHGELVWHALACGLVAVVALVAEGRRAHIEGDAQPVRLLVRDEAAEYGHEAVYPVGRSAVGRVEHAHAVIRSVHYTVAVEYHQLHKTISHCDLCPL